MANVSMSSSTTSSASNGNHKLARKEMHHKEPGCLHEFTMGFHRTIASSKDEAHCKVAVPGRRQ
jgi:hypothetical protein